MRFLLILAIVVLGLYGCSSEKNEELLPKATGRPGDVLVIMDSVQWRGELGQEFRKVFMSPYPGLPQNEPIFNIIFVHPSKGLSMLKQLRNVVFVLTLDQKTSGSKTLARQFSEETIKRIRQDTSFNLSTAKNEFSKGQEVMYLVGNTQQDLISYISSHKQNIIDYFNKAERERMSAQMFKTKSTKGVANFLKQEQQVEIHVPIGYRLAEKTEDFVWLRSMTSQTDKDIFITWKPYTSEYQLLPDSLIEWRNQTARRYLFEDPAKAESFLVTEQEDAKVIARQMKLNGNFAMELRGLWRTNLRTMGGPFVSYTLIDQPKGLLYYIEGFAYAPGRDKREMMRELETILWTFRTSEDLKKK